MTSRSYSGGYIGLLVLLIATSIAIYLWYQSTPKDASGNPAIMQQIQAEGHALDIKAAQEARNKKIEQMIEAN